jgi:hypothetical protein
VAERVELHTADMTALPFQDETFDIVLSNLPTIVLLADAPRVAFISIAFQAGTRRHAAAVLKAPEAVEANRLDDVQSGDEDLNSADSPRSNFDSVLCC